MSLSSRHQMWFVGGKQPQTLPHRAAAPPSPPDQACSTKAALRGRWAGSPSHTPLTLLTSRPACRPGRRRQTASFPPVGCFNLKEDLQPANTRSRQSKNSQLMSSERQTCCHILLNQIHLSQCVLSDLWTSLDQLTRV